MENPDLSTEEIDVLLTGLRRDITGPKKVVVVIVLVGLAPSSAYVIKGKPKNVPGGHDPVFLATVRRIWRQYDAAGVVPIVLTRTDPTTFTGLKIATLPWAPESEKWCLQCGRRLAGASHRC